MMKVTSCRRKCTANKQEPGSAHDRRHIMTSPGYTGISRRDMQTSAPCNMQQFWPPFRSLENWYSLTPVCEKKYGNVILRPPYSSKFGEMFSFYSPFRPFVAFWINGRGWARVWASPSETHQSAPHPGQTRQQTKYVYSNGKNGNCGISGGILPLTRYSLITS